MIFPPEIDEPKTVRPTRKRKLVDGVCEQWDVSIRRACRVLEVDTSTYHYRSRRHDQVGLEARINEISATRVRYGYRRVHVLLRREGRKVNAEKVYRIYNGLGLQLCNKTPKRRVRAKLRNDRQVASRPNETLAMDFVHDQLATGRKIRVLTVVDTFSRFSPVIDPGFSYVGKTWFWLSRRPVRRLARRRPSGWIRARNSSRVTCISGRMPTRSRWTSPGLANRPITLSSRRSTAACKRNA